MHRFISVFYVKRAMEVAKRAAMILMACIVGSMIGTVIGYACMTYYFAHKQKQEDYKLATTVPVKTYREFTVQELEKIKGMQQNTEKDQNVFRRSDEIVAQEEERE